MNCTLTRATSAELNTLNTSGIHASLPSDALSIHNAYATAPMAAILPPYQPPSDEELHSSFEEAISKRTSTPALYKIQKLSHVHYTQDTYASDRITFTSAPHSTTITRKQRHIQLLPSSTWQRCIVWISLALIFTMLGFDLMGLLILHMH